MNKDLVSISNILEAVQSHFTGFLRSNRQIVFGSNWYQKIRISLGEKKCINIDRLVKRYNLDKSISHEEWLNYLDISAIYTILSKEFNLFSTKFDLPYDVVRRLGIVKSIRNDNAHKPNSNVNTDDRESLQELLYVSKALMKDISNLDGVREIDKIIDDMSALPQDRIKVTRTAKSKALSGSSLPLKIETLLKDKPGLTDREITDIIKGQGEPQQHVNQSCRSLAKKGIVKRIKREDNLIGNYLA